jgi:predicted DNA repair protein MutK
MAAGSLLALIDDIASVLDDVALMSKVAAKKTAGVLGDDLALNAQQVTGVHADRELPVVWAVALGSLRNKAILVPAALAISAFVPQAITPLLMLGGAFLCFEGFEKLAHKYMHSAAEDAAHEEELVTALAAGTDMRAVEQDKIKGAVRTDFILSAEIIVISLGVVNEQSTSFGAQVAALVAVAIAMTVGVYGLVAAIVKIDDAGLWLSKRAGGADEGIVGDRHGGHVHGRWRHHRPRGRTAAPPGRKRGARGVRRARRRRPAGGHHPDRDRRGGRGRHRRRGAAGGDARAAPARQALKRSTAREGRLPLPARTFRRTPAPRHKRMLRHAGSQSCCGITETAVIAHLPKSWNSSLRCAPGRHFSLDEFGRRHAGGGTRTRPPFRCAAAPARSACAPFMHPFAPCVRKCCVFAYLQIESFDNTHARSPVSKQGLPPVKPDTVFLPTRQGRADHQTDTTLYRIHSQTTIRM